MRPKTIRKPPPQPTAPLFFANSNFELKLKSPSKISAQRVNLIVQRAVCLLISPAGLNALSAVLIDAAIPPTTSLPSSVTLHDVSLPLSLWPLPLLSLNQIS